MPCVSLLLCLYHTVLVTALPPPTPSNVESACNDSGCEGPFKLTLLIEGGGGMREFEMFWGKCPKTFGQDCTFELTISWDKRLTSYLRDYYNMLKHVHHEHPHALDTRPLGHLK